jgi:hypothetical protein
MARCRPASPATGAGANAQPGPRLRGGGPGGEARRATLDRPGRSRRVNDPMCFLGHSGCLADCRGAGT